MSQSEPLTAVPPFEFTPEGPMAPEAPDVLEGVRADWQGAYGPAIATEPGTPTGQVMDSTAALVISKNADVMTMANMFNPDSSEGIWQDALGRIYFLDRHPARGTVTRCLCVGLSGTLIPAGSLAQSESNHIFAAIQSGVIPESGELHLDFQCQETGPVPAPAGSVSRIYRAIPGWDTVTNPEAGILGRNLESRLEFEERRRESVAKNGQGSVQAVYGEIANLEGVTDLFVTDNRKSVPVEKYGVSVSGHSLFASVTGGTDLDVATAVFNRLSGGCGMDGNTTVTVNWLDQDGLAVPEEVTFNRPSPLRIRVRVRLIRNDSVPADVESLVQAAVVSNFYGLSEDCAGLGRVRMGRTVYASRFYPAVIKAGGTDVLDISVSAGEAVDWADSLATTIDQQPGLDQADVLVEVLDARQAQDLLQQKALARARALLADLESRVSKTQDGPPESDQEPENES